MARTKKEPLVTTDEATAAALFPDPPLNLAGKLAAAGLEIGYIQKNGFNTGQKYTYVRAEDVLKKANEALFSRGVCIQSSASLERYEASEVAGKSKVRAAVRITLAFIDSTGQPWIDAAGRTQPPQSYQCEGLGEGTDSGDKAILKANTAALKYALSNAFLISWGDDPEADAATDRDAAVVAQKPSSKMPASKTDVVALIAAATLENMGEVRKAVMAERGTEAYDALVASCKAKQEEIGWTP